MHLPGYNFCGPGTKLNKRLNEDLTPKPWSKPINRVDEACYKHDIGYMQNSDIQTRNILDGKMLSDLKAIYNPTVGERLARGFISPIIGLKKRFGMGLDDSETSKKKKSISLSDELHRPVRRNYPTRRVIVKHLDETWAADLMFMPKKIKKGEAEGMEEIQQQQADRVQQTASEKQIGNLNIFLVVIDVFSRYAWVRQIPNRQVNNVVKAFKDIFETSKRKPEKLWTDRGGEFTGLIDKEAEKPKTDFQCPNCKEYFKSKTGLTNHIKNYCPVLFPDKAKETKTRLKGVEMYHTEGQSKTTVAESFIKTLKNKIGRWMTENNTVDYLPHLQEIVKKYNETPHSVFKHRFTPDQASDPKNQDTIYKDFYENAKPRNVKDECEEMDEVDRITQKTPLDVGDLVRISRIKAAGFEKGFTPNWTKEIFKIREVKNTDPTTYYLSDAKDHHITGAFYRPEIQKTRFKIADWMGYTQPRIKENARRGMQAVQVEATRQKEKKQRQRDRIKAAKTVNPQPSTSQDGFGLEISKTVKNLPIKSLNNFELTDVCKNLKGWRGVFSRDALPEKPNMYDCGILNLDDSEGPGTHWTAWHRNKKLKFYFDSYGLPPPLELKNYLKSPILYSSDQIQNPDTVICGHLCVHVLEKLNEGFHLQPIASYLMDLKEKGLI